jgi:uncharacterized membrane protein YcaP (DUF421 family)
MASIIIRTLIIYLLLMVILRLMGKREIGQLDASDLVSTLLISELAAIPIDDPDIPLFNAVVPILFIFALEVLLSAAKNRSPLIGRAIDGDACFIIYKGRILQDALKENRVSTPELLSAIRTQGVGDISDVEYALLEQNGTISVLQGKQNTVAHAVLIDGEPVKKTLSRIGKSEDWLLSEIKKRSLEPDEIFLMTATDDFKIQVIKKEIEK